MDPLFGAALTAGRADMLAAAAARDEAGVLARIDAERIGPLLAWRLRRSGELAATPRAVKRRLEQREREAAAVELLQRRELLRILDALDGDGVRPLLMKGAALAYSHYPQPFLRPREDLDFLIAPTAGAAVRSVLERIGYRPAVSIAGELVMHQFHYERNEAGYRHACDVHVKLLNPQVFAGALSYEEAARAASAVPALGVAARTLCPVHAVLLACLHRIAHHDGTDDLLWLFDLRLLCAGLREDDFDALVALAASRRVAAVTAAALARAATLVGAQVPAHAVAQLRQAGRSGEPSAGHLAANLMPPDVLLSDLAALSGWRSRLRLLKEHLFPPRRYIQAKYGVRSAAAVSAAYAWRIARGAPRWLRRD